MVATHPTLRWLSVVTLGMLGVGFGLIAGVNPKLAIAGALGLAFMLIVLADLTAGLCAFTFLSFVALVPSGIGPTVSFLKVAGALLLISWLATTVRDRSSGKTFFSAHPGLAWLVIGFLTWVALSATWAESNAAVFTALSRYALNAVLFLIVFSAVRKEDDAIWVITAFLAGSVIAALYGLLSQPSSSIEADRLSGTIGNPNELAAILVVGASLSVGLAATLKRSPALRLATVSAGALCIIGLAFTQSRTGLVACGFALVAGIAFAGKSRGRIAILALLVAFVGFGYFTAVASQSVRDRISNFGNGTGRTDLWQVGRRMVDAHPLRGVGAGNFPITSVHFLLEPGSLTRTDFIIDTPKVAHNTYLEVLAELGIVGLSLFLAVLGSCLVFAAGAIRNFKACGNARMEIITRSVLVALIALLAADFFDSEQFQKPLWLLLGLCPALLAISLSASEGTASAPRELDH